MSLGAHLSISGGLHLALHRGKVLDCRAVQIFLKNQMQWAAPPLKDEQIAQFLAAKRETGIRTVLAHDSYLINLASPDESLWRKSVDALHEELERCESLEIEGLVAHPGSHTGAGEESGLRRISEALDIIHGRTPGYRARAYLETTAGQGSYLGYRFEHLRSIIDLVRDPGRLAVCLDTCHVFAAGYDIRDAAAFAATMDEFDQVIGLDKLKAFHLNDSKGKLGSTVDRHAHIGKGRIGRAGFAALLNDPRFLRTPMFLETPKEDDMDRRNLRLLRRLQRPEWP
jgi:deoxyribonuclease-4